MARKVGRVHDAVKSRHGYPSGQNRKVRSRKRMANTKIISAMKGK